MLANIRYQLPRSQLFPLRHSEIRRPNGFVRRPPPVEKSALRACSLPVGSSCWAERWSSNSVGLAVNCATRKYFAGIEPFRK